MGRIYDRYNAAFERVMQEQQRRDAESFGTQLLGEQWETAKQLLAWRQSVPEEEKLPDLEAALRRFAPTWSMLRLESGEDAYERAQQLSEQDADLKSDLELISQALRGQQAIEDLYGDFSGGH